MSRRTSAALVVVLALAAPAPAQVNPPFPVDGPVLPLPPGYPLGPGTPRPAPPQPTGPIRFDRNGDPLPAGAVARAGSARWRHGPDFAALGFSPDGRLLITLGSRVVKVWQWPEGKPLFSVTAGEQESFVKAAVSPDGRHLSVFTSGSIAPTALAGDASGLAPIGSGVRVCEIPSGKQVCLLGHTDRQVVAHCWMPDSKQVAVAWGDGKVRFHDAATGKETRELGPVNGLTTPMTVSPDGKSLACAANAGGLHLWDVVAGKRLRYYDDAAVAGNWLDLVAFSPDGKSLATGSNGSVRLYRTDQQDPVHRGDWPEFPIGEVRFAAGGKEVVAISPQGGRIRMDASTGKELEVITPPNPRGSTALSPDGKWLAIYDSGRIARLDATKFEPPAGEPPIELPALSATFADGGRQVVTIDRAGTIARWDSETGRELKRFGLAGIEAVGQPPVLAPGGKWVALLGLKAEVVVHDAETGQPARELPGGDNGINLVQFGPGGRLMAGVTGEGRLRLWDLTTGKDLGRFNDLAVGGILPSFAPDGRTLLAHDVNAGMRVLEVATGRPRGTLTPQQVGVGILGPNSLAALAEGAFVNVYRLGERDKEGKPAAKLQRALEVPFGDQAISIAFSPDGKLLAVGTGRGLSLYDLRDGEEVSRPAGHVAGVFAVAFSPDGSRLLSASQDDVVLLWDVAALARRAGSPPVSAIKLADAWAGLASPEGEAAFAAVCEFADRPAEAIPFFRKHLPPLPPVDPDRLKAAIDDLENPRFAARQKAARDLAQLGERAAAALRKRLESGPPPQTRKAIEELIDRQSDPAKEPEGLRNLRAIEALERMATPEATKFLEELASDAPEAGRTREARAALDRLKK